MNYQEALAFIHKKNNFAASPGLERMQRLCELLGYQYYNKNLLLKPTQNRPPVSSERPH